MPRRGRRVNAGTETDHQLNSNGAGHQQKRCRQAGEDQCRHLGLLDIGPSKIALNQVRQVPEVLLPKREIEAELAANAFHRLRRGAAASDLADRVGGHEVEQDIGDERDA